MWRQNINHYNKTTFIYYYKNIRYIEIIRTIQCNIYLWHIKYAVRRPVFTDIAKKICFSVTRVSISLILVMRF